MKTMIMAGKRNARTYEVQVENQSRVKLSRFKVQGWVRDVESPPMLVGYDMRSREGRKPLLKSARVPMKVEVITALDSFAAAQQYARMKQVKPFQWLQVDPNPQVNETVDVVIRVEEC